MTEMILGGKPYTDRIAYINTLARLAGLTYGQYVARYCTPEPQPEPPQKQQSHCVVCGRPFPTYALGTVTKIYCSRSCMNRAYYLRKQKGAPQ